MTPANNSVHHNIQSARAFCADVEFARSFNENFLCGILPIQRRGISYGDVKFVTTSRRTMKVSIQDT